MIQTVIFQRKNVILRRVYSEAQETFPWPLSASFAATSERLVKLMAFSVYIVFYQKKILGRGQWYAWLSGGVKQAACAHDPSLTPADWALICRLG